MEDGRRKTEDGKDGKIDLAIDRAVREMLDVEPRADLRARVIEQIETPLSPFDFVVSAFRRNLAWAPLAVGAAAVIVAIALSWRTETPEQAPRLVQATDTHLPVETPGAPPQPQTTIPERTPVTTVARVVTPRPRMAVTSGSIVATNTVEDVAFSIEPMGSLAPIVVAPVAQRSIAPADLAMRPLNPIAEMQIAPLNPPERRN